MFAGTTSKDRPLNNKISAHHKSLIHPRAHFLILFLALASLYSPHASSQVVNATSPSWAELVGAYSEPATGKSVRIVLKGGQLICQSADGLAFAEYHLLQALPGDLFEIAETSTRIRNELSFFRDKSGKVVGLKFAGHTYLRDASNGSEASPPVASNGPLASPAPFPGPTPPRLPPEL